MNRHGPERTFVPPMASISIVCCARSRDDRVPLLFLATLLLYVRRHRGELRLQ